MYITAKLCQHLGNFLIIHKTILHVPLVATSPHDLALLESARHARCEVPLCYLQRPERIFVNVVVYSVHAIKYVPSNKSGKLLWRRKFRWMSLPRFRGTPLALAKCVEQHRTIISLIFSLFAHFLASLTPGGGEKQCERKAVVALLFHRPHWSKIMLRLFDKRMSFQFPLTAFYRRNEIMQHRVR